MNNIKERLKQHITYDTGLSLLLIEDALAEIERLENNLRGAEITISSLNEHIELLKDDINNSTTYGQDYLGY